MKSLDFSVLIRIFVRNIFFILPLSLFGILIGDFVSSSTVPIFRASADLFVSTPASAIDLGLLATGSTFSQQRVKSYTEIINAPATLQPVIDRLKLSTTPEALALRIKATAPPDTVVIRLSVVDENPNRAAAIANEVSMQFALTVETIELPQENSSSPVKVSVARPAVPNYDPISPKKNTNRLIGFFGCAVLTYLFFLVRYSLDSTVKNVFDLDDLPLLAAIGFDPNADRTPLISEIGPYEARTEAFRTFRTNLLNSLENINGSIIAITSGVAEEGKTTSAINLALSISNQGLKVLLIEADLRRPRLGKYLQNSNSDIIGSGLSDLLESNNDATLKKLLKACTLEISEQLLYLHAGPIKPNPTELLAGPNLEKVLRIARINYDVVIVDCPPVLPVTDASVICQHVDGVVVIVHGGHTKLKSFEATKDILSAVDARILGVVINKIPNSRESEDYGYKSGYSKNYKRTYGYVFKRRGYTPYGPYNPKELAEIDNETLKAGRLRKSEDDSKENNVGIIEKALEVPIFKKKTSTPDLADGINEPDLDIEEWLNKLRLSTGSKFAPTKKTTKNVTSSKNIVRKPTQKKSK